MVSQSELLVLNFLLHYKFLTLSQLTRLVDFKIDSLFLEKLEEKEVIKALKNREKKLELETLYFALPNPKVEIDKERYFQDIDLRQLSITKQDYFHIFYTVDYHILFDKYIESRNMEVNYFSSYFDIFKNKTKKNELKASGRFELSSGDYIIPNATMNFTLPSGEEFIYALDLFCDNHIEDIVQRVRKYNQVFLDNKYKLDRIVFIFEDNITQTQGIEHILDADILSSHKNDFIFKTIKELEADFSLYWSLFYSEDKINFISQIAQKKEQILEADSIEVSGFVEHVIELEPIDVEEIQGPKRLEAPKKEIQRDIPVKEQEKSVDEEAEEKMDENLQNEPKEEQNPTLQEEISQEEFMEKVSKAQEEIGEKEEQIPQTASAHEILKKRLLGIAQDVSIFMYLLAGVAAFIVSAYMEMLAFDSFYPGFILISVVMVIAFEVAKVGTIFMRIHIKNSKTELNKITLKVLNSLFIPLLFGLSIISSMAVTADKLESPHAEELKQKSIKKIQTEYDEIMQLTEKDHLRRTKQLKEDFFDKLKEFDKRRKEVLASKDAQIEKQKNVYGADGKTWKGSKYEEHVKERKTLVTQFAAERVQLERLYNEQIEDESRQYRKEKKEDLKYKADNLKSAESEVLANSWQAQNEMVRSFIKVVNHGFHLSLKELDFIFMLSILVSVLLELTIYKVFTNISIAYVIRKQ